MTDTDIVLTGGQIEVARWLQVRSALKIEIKTGLRHSRGSVLKLANQITGEASTTKVRAYRALNDFIVERLGADFDRPLER
jgi:hypothetical protein